MDIWDREIRAKSVYEEQQAHPTEMVWANYDPAYPVRMKIRAKPRRFPLKWWIKLLNWLRVE